MASHRGKNPTCDEIAQRFFWHNIAGYFSEYIKSCEQCQKQGDLKSPKVELNLIPVSSSVMKQVGGGICNFPELDVYLHVIVLIYCFSKWSEAKPIKDKSNYRSIFVQRDVSSRLL